MDLASGLHHRLTDIPASGTRRRVMAARSPMRHPTREFAVGNGGNVPQAVPDGRHRLLIGKMFTALALEKEMRGRG
jgi:hypothetical protein